MRLLIIFFSGSFFFLKLLFFIFIIYKYLTINFYLNSEFSGRFIEFFDHKFSFSKARYHISYDGLGFKLDNFQEITKKAKFYYKDPVVIYFNPWNFTLNLKFNGKTNAHIISLSPAVDRNIESDIVIKLSFKLSYKLFEKFINNEKFKILADISEIEYIRNKSIVTDPMLKDEIIFNDEGSRIKLKPIITENYINFDHMILIPPKIFSATGNLNIVFASVIQEISPGSFINGLFFSGKQMGDFNIDYNYSKPRIFIKINNFNTEAATGDLSFTLQRNNDKKLYLDIVSNFELNDKIYDFFKNHIFLEYLSSLSNMIKSNKISKKTKTEIDYYLDYIYSKDSFNSNNSALTKENDVLNSNLSKENSLFKPENINLLFPKFNEYNKYNFKIYITSEGDNNLGNLNIENLMLKNSNETGIFISGKCKLNKERNCDLNFLIKNYNNILDFILNYYFTILKQEANSKYINFIKKYNKDYLLSLSKNSSLISTDIDLQINFEKNNLKINNKDIKNILSDYMRKFIISGLEFSLDTDFPEKTFRKYFPYIKDYQNLLKIVSKKKNIPDDLWLRLIN